MLTSRKSLSTNSVADCSKEIEGRGGGGGVCSMQGKFFAYSPIRTVTSY